MSAGDAVAAGPEVAASAVQVGDVLMTSNGLRLRVDRIEPFLFPGMLAFVEDSERQWLKVCARPEDRFVRLADG